MCEVLRIASKGREKICADGLFEFERKTRETRRIMRMRTSLPVGGDGDMSKYNIIIIIINLYTGQLLYFFNPTVRLSFILKSTLLGLRHGRPSISRTFPLKDSQHQV